MALLKDEVSEVKYKTFFQPVTPAFANNDILILTTPDAFSQEQITPMIPLIRNCISVAIGKELDVKVELPDSSLTLDMIHQHSSSTPPVTSESSVSQLNPAYTFDSFIVGRRCRTRKSSMSTASASSTNSSRRSRAENTMISVKNTEMPIFF